MSPKKENKDRKRVVSCGCVVHRANPVTNEIELLLIKQFEDHDVWGIPKGRMNRGETFEQCAVRETREEAGVTVELGLRLMDVDLQLKNKDKTVISYLARQVCNNTPRADDPDSEVADVAWFHESNLPQIQQYQRSIIAEALAVLHSNKRY